MATGHVLWIAQGKKKKVVYDFIEHVGMDWMRHVDAVALDMNSDFEEAFLEKCPHIRPVFDYFHLVKNFNDKVVSEVRKDEFKRLMEEGKEEEARMLKRERTLSPQQGRCYTGRAGCLLRRKRDEQDGIYPGTRNSSRRIVCS